ncbi:hypothetical protein SAMN05444481_12545 [Flavobacterium frigidimaris]|nr:hypothetical protein SAMN05444481_12545 [Flavobacterium frigidimaris]
MGNDNYHFDGKYVKPRHKKNRVISDPVFHYH